jgi:ABC-type spermidine/putrescine transport system permease subunit II
MTLAAACGWSLIRSLIVALAAWPVCHLQVTWLSGLERRQCRLAWMALVIPFLCPELWSGYAWSNFAVRLADTGLWNLFPLPPMSIIARDAAIDELVLDLLLFFRTVPVGTVAMFFAPPPPLSREALHCRKLVSFGLRDRLWFALYGRYYTAIPATALMFLVAFQEFELASLIGRPAWTVWLFDAQAGGLAISESLRLTVLPVVCQSIVLVPLLWTILTSRSNQSPREQQARQLARRTRWTLWFVVVVGLAMTCVVPAILVGGGTVDGLRRVVQNSLQLRMLLKEILVGAGYALTAAAAATFIATFVIRAASASRLAAAGMFWVAIPGLVGSLVLGLALIHLFQQPFARFAYKTPLSLLAGFIVFLLPRSMALRLLLSAGNSTGLYLATLLRESGAMPARDRARELTWRLRWRGEFWSVALLAYWAFFDLTLAYLLAPVTIVSAPVMLYNQMHFGKNAILSALVFLTVLVPVLMIVMVAAMRRFLFRWIWR